MKKKIQGNEGERDESDKEDKGREHIDSVDYPTKNQRAPIEGEGEKVGGCESDYIGSSDPVNCIDISSGFNVNNAQGHSQIGRTMTPNVSLEEFFLDLRFPNLELFRNVLVEFSTKKRFEACRRLHLVDSSFMVQCKEAICGQTLCGRTFMSFWGFKV